MKHSKDTYQSLQKYVQNFINTAQKAVADINHHHHKVEEAQIKAIASSVFYIEQFSGHISYDITDDEKIELTLLQNIIHDQVYSFDLSSRKKVSIFQAAKSWSESNDDSELQDILYSCAKDHQAFHHLCCDLYDICKQISEYIQTLK